MLRRFNTGYEDGNYGVPSGHLDGNEKVTQAAIREVHEEIGVDVQPQNLKVCGVMHRKSDDERVDFFLVTKVWSGELENQEPNKCDNLGWFSMSQLPANTIPYIKRALENHQNCQMDIWFEEFGW